MPPSPLVFDFTADAKSIVVDQSAKRKLWPGNPLPFWFNINVQTGTEIITPGMDPVEIDQDDWHGIFSPGGTYVERYTITPIPDYPDQPAFDSVGYSLSDPSVCSIDDRGITTYISDGDTDVDVTCTVGDTSFTRSISQPLSFTKVEGAGVFEKMYPRAGTLREDVTDAIDSRIAGANPATQKGMYTDNTWSVRNLSCWAATVDLTCASPWNSRNANRRAGTLVTPRHVINAAHYQLQVGDTLWFVSPTNEVVEKTIVGKKVHPDYSPALGYQFDFCIYTLDSDVPSSITFSTVLPSDYEDYIPTGIRDMPVLFLDQEEKALVANGGAILGSYLNDVSLTITPPPITDYPKRREFYEVPISGDSGNPLFLIVDNKPVLLSVFTSSSGGSFITNTISAINQMIEDSDLSAGITPTGYSLTTCDLSPFMSFT